MRPEGPGATMRFAGKLAGDGRSDGTHLGDAETTLSAMPAASPTSLPCEAHDSLFILESEVELAKVVADAPPGRGCHCVCARVGETPPGRHRCPAPRGQRHL